MSSSQQDTDLDPAAVLEDYLLGAENLAPEMRHLFGEIVQLDTRVHELRKSAAAAQMTLYKTERARPDKAAYFPSKEENNAVTRIRKMHQEALDLSFEKTDIAEQARRLLEIYIHRLDAEFLRLGIDLPEDPVVPEHLSDMESDDSGDSSVDDDRAGPQSAASFASSSHRGIRTAGFGSGGPGGDDALLSADIGSLMQLQTAGIRRISSATSSALAPPLSSGGSMNGRRRRRMGTGGGNDLALGNNFDSPEVYCICKRGSFGDMIGCDNETCPIEWFHYECVGLNAPPKGRWYCPICTPKMQKKKKTAGGGD